VIKAATSTVAMMVLSGCALQQAPLVYSSKISVGVDLSATSSETPGASINLGYKSIDAAYVPVAVSKKIDDKSTGQTTPVIELISAKYGAGALPNSGDAKAALAKLHADLQATTTASENLRSTITILEANQRTIQQRVELLTQLENTLESAKKLRPLPAEGVVPIDLAPFGDALKPATETIQKLGALNVKLANVLTTKKADGKDSVDEVKNEAGDLKQKSLNQSTEVARDIETSKKALGLNEQKVASINREISSTLDMYRTDKTDALSVYGRFDSNGTGSFDSNDSDTRGTGGKAGLLIGKVFSTGLASQNLTEAVKYESVTRCLLAMADLVKSAPETEKKSVTDKLMVLCESKK
jgi:hypothetical protein